MKSTKRLVATLLVPFLALGASASLAADTKVTLSGAQEVPAVTTSATGTGTISVSADKKVTGSIETTGVEATAAHIHVGAAGKNGPVAIGLTKTGDNRWSVPPGSTLTDEQYASYKAGELYINVHSAANKGGEIRGQLKP